MANLGDLLGKGDSLVWHVIPYLCVCYYCIIARDILCNYAIIATQRYVRRGWLTGAREGLPTACTTYIVCHTYIQSMYIYVINIRMYISTLARRSSELD